jgi:predicted transcriptional regulator YdeE
MNWDVQLLNKSSFTVIGKLGQRAAHEGTKWIPPLWQEANGQFHEIRSLAKLDENGRPAGVWGAMSDVDERFERWTDRGKYLAGCEAVDEAEAPAGWTNWVVPSYRYAVVACTIHSYHEAFEYMVKDYLPRHEYKIVGAVHEYYNPADTNGELSLYFPIEKK